MWSSEFLNFLWNLLNQFYSLLIAQVIKSWVNFRTLQRYPSHCWKDYAGNFRSNLIKNYAKHSWKLVFFFFCFLIMYNLRIACTSWCVRFVSLFSTYSSFCSPKREILQITMVLEKIVLQLNFWKPEVP